MERKSTITLKIKRDGVVKAIKGIVSLPFEDKQTLTATDASKSKSATSMVEKLN
jgi:hypothetical protein